MAALIGLHFLEMLSLETLKESEKKGRPNQVNHCGACKSYFT